MRRVFVGKEEIGGYILAGEQRADGSVVAQELGNAINLEWSTVYVLTKLADAFPQFNRKYGKQLPSGEYQIPAPWQAGLSNVRFPVNFSAKHKSNLNKTGCQCGRNHWPLYQRLCLGTFRIQIYGYDLFDADYRFHGYFLHGANSGTFAGC